ncbi:hypothetical protein QAD02_002033 [Eretmocerus hayati]|uniref:Uncharacterized protein n=1 Tax=Eretmocerus hayati TaxID=131215 RepID=A0ACC2NKC5_9HYME|nr:hypothetical protein QAD02_002033 [Eretmocerus hayati]
MCLLGVIYQKQRELLINRHFPQQFRSTIVGVILLRSRSKMPKPPKSIVSSSKTKKDESSKERTYTYYAVEFINPGRKPKTRCVDVVLKDWFTNKRNKEGQRTQVHYPSDPTDKNYLYRLQRLLPHHPEWPTFTVAVRGRSDSYSDILMKLDKLKVSDSALTMSSGEDAEQLSKREIDNLHRNALVDQANQFSKEVSLAKSKTKNQKSSVSKSDLNECLDPLDTCPATSTVAVNNHTSAKHEPYEYTKKSSHSLSKQAAVQKCYPGQKNKKQKELTGTSGKLSKSHISSTVSTKDSTEEQINIKEKMSNVSNKISCSQQHAITHVQPKEQVLIAPESVDTADSYLSNLPHAKSESDVVPQVLTELQGMKKSVVNLATAIHKDMESLKSMIAKISVGEHVPSNFIDDKEKLSKGFDFAIPFRRSKHFEEFDSQLASNDELVTLVTSLLRPEVDTTSIPKTFKHMIQMFMTKRAASRWTAIQKMPKKKVFKNTNFYKIARGLVKKGKALKKEPAVRDKEFRTALSSVLTNVHGWKEDDAEVCEDDSSSEYSTTSEEVDNSSETSRSSEEKKDLLLNDSSPTNSISEKNGSKVTDSDEESVLIPKPNPTQIPITDNFPNDLFDNVNFSDIDTDEQDFKIY